MISNNILNIYQLYCGDSLIFIKFYNFKKIYFVLLQYVYINLF